MTRVLVTDARLGSAVAVIRSLGRAGYDVIAADSRPFSAGIYSRYACGRLRYPVPQTFPDDVVDALLETARTRSIDLIFPVTDEVIMPLSEQRDRFDGVCTLALPDPGVLALAWDKNATFDLARRLSIPTPRTAQVTTVEEALDAADDLGWPVVLKPQASRILRTGSAVEAFSVGYANTPRELEERMRHLEGRTTVLLQEYCSGEARGVGLLAVDGETLRAFEYRRLREMPPTGGPSSFRESVPLDDVHYDHATRLARALRWTGLAMIEFKGADPATLMEVNGRVWGSIALAVKSGVDFPAEAARLYLTGDVARTSGAYSVGVRSRDLRLEVSWIAAVLRGRRKYPFIAYPPRRAALGVALRLFASRDGFDVLSWKDPKASLAEIGSLGWRYYAKLKRDRSSRRAEVPEGSIS